MADGDWLIGYGCATTCYPTQMAPAAARVRLQRDGRVRVEIAGHEIGNGAYTVIGQAAAEKLGVPVEKVSVFIGDSDLPPAPVAGGSNSTASTCSAVMMVCDQIRQRLFKALMPNESLVDKAKETVGVGTNAGHRGREERSAARPREGLRCARRQRGRGIWRVEARRRADGFVPRDAQGSDADGRRPRDEGQDRLRLRRGIRRGPDQPMDPRNPRAAAARRLRRRPHHEPAHRAQPADGRADLGHVVGAAGGDRDSTSAMRATSTTISPTIWCR